MELPSYFNTFSQEVNLEMIKKIEIYNIKAQPKYIIAPTVTYLHYHYILMQKQLHYTSRLTDVEKEPTGLLV